MKDIISYKYILLIILFIILHVLFTTKIQIRIIKDIILTKKQKIIHSFLIWLIPFLWYILFRKLIFHRLNTMNKNKRDKLIKIRKYWGYEGYNNQ